MHSTQSTKIKFNTLLLCLLLIFTSVVSCKKYPEGPAISISSKSSRLSNVWKVEKVIKNGADVSSLFTSTNYTETYEKNGGFSFSSSLFNGSGAWNFANNNTMIKRSGVNGQISSDITILRLKSNSLWYKSTFNGDSYEFHLIPN